MRFMILFQDVPGAKEELQKVLGKKNLGATAKEIRTVPIVDSENNNSIVCKTLALCFEGSYISYFMNKIQAKMNNCIIVKRVCI